MRRNDIMSEANEVFKRLGLHIRLIYDNLQLILQNNTMSEQIENITIYQFMLKVELVVCLKKI